MNRNFLISILIFSILLFSCNLNGFEIAEYSSSFGEISLLSIGLYGIFAFSCLGAVLLLLLILNKQISTGWDWFILIGAISSTIIALIQMTGGNLEFNRNMFQSGAYVILVGLIISFLCMIMASYINDNIRKEELYLNE